MEKLPPLPEKNCPLWDRVTGRTRMPSDWVKLAHNAEKDKRYGDAYYFWLEALAAYTRAGNKSKGITRVNAWKTNAEKCLNKWKK